MIETDNERMLIDTGLYAAAAANSASHYGGALSMRAFEFEQEESIADQVDLDTVINSAIRCSAGVGFRPVGMMRRTNAALMVRGRTVC